MINNREFTLVTSNSKEVIPGSLFVAIRGLQVNGENFIPEALAKGAKLIVTSNEFQDTTASGKIKKVTNPRQYLSLAAKEFYFKQPENIAAITGTNGKTSTANFFKQICSYYGFKSASVGTLGVVCDDIDFDNNDALTSPDPVKLHSILQTLAENKITHLSIEASSHGLEQYRMDGVNIKAAAFTNLTREHLDYHHNMENYFEAKKRLFTELVQESAVLNADTQEYKELYEVCKARKLNILSYGKDGENIKLLDYSNNNLTILVDDEKFSTHFNLMGDFQVYNAMCALALSIAIGIKSKAAVAAFPYLKAVSGRLEYVGQYNEAKIFVDFAHKPDALANVLNSLKSSLKGKLHVLFGCGGDRDSGKRIIMGEIAQELADYVIVTDDNPRTEDPSKIRRQILEGCPKATEIGDRSQAIKIAINQLQPNDILVIAGKGHEDYQVIGTEKKHFSDQEEVKKYIKSHA